MIATHPYVSENSSEYIPNIPIKQIFYMLCYDRRCCHAQRERRVKIRMLSSLLSQNAYFSGKL